MTTVENVLEHHGIKGMHWGVRRVNPSGGDNRVVSVSAKPGSIKTSGGRGIAPHDDAVSAHIALQKVAGSGLHSLSNTELQNLNNRLNLEANFAKTMSKRPSKTPKTDFVKAILLKTAKQELLPLAKGETGPLTKSLDQFLAPGRRTKLPPATGKPLVVPKGKFKILKPTRP